MKTLPDKGASRKNASFLAAPQTSRLPLRQIPENSTPRIRLQHAMPSPAGQTICSVLPAQNLNTTGFWKIFRGTFFPGPSLIQDGLCQHIGYFFFCFFRFVPCLSGTCLRFVTAALSDIQKERPVQALMFSRPAGQSSFTVCPCFRKNTLSLRTPDAPAQAKTA